MEYNVHVYDGFSGTLDIFTIATIQIPLWVQYQFVHCLIQFVIVYFTISNLAYVSKKVHNTCTHIFVMNIVVRLQSKIAF
jgi:hypothetical protein